MSLWFHRLDKKPTKLFLDFCPGFFCTFLGASWKLFGAFCRLPYLWYYLLSPHEAKKASRKLPGRYKKFQGRNPGNNFVGILEETIISSEHYKINWPLLILPEKSRLEKQLASPNVVCTVVRLWQIDKIMVFIISHFFKIG